MRAPKLRPPDVLMIFAIILGFAARLDTTFLKRKRTPPPPGNVPHLQTGMGEGRHLFWLAPSAATDTQRHRDHRALPRWMAALRVPLTPSSCIPPASQPPAKAVNSSAARLVIPTRSSPAVGCRASRIMGRHLDDVAKQLCEESKSEIMDFDQSGIAKEDALLSAARPLAAPRFLSGSLPRPQPLNDAAWPLKLGIFHFVSHLFLSAPLNPKLPLSP
ncbi:hypothetical protein CPLU01_03825 [Colletotrichum plurivorum]|uniref:Uncharacterized protein n=1 Tax=Colletotrichum plurivorum TaxID=2175906 RepID=A0A8H6KSH3_9PEZI|nr:hypothetical protein CPLU01_03825 [Colletotrichum plurivorum]